MREICIEIFQYILLGIIPLLSCVKIYTKFLIDVGPNKYMLKIIISFGYIKSNKRRNKVKNYFFWKIARNNWKNGSGEIISSSMTKEVSFIFDAFERFSLDFGYKIKRKKSPEPEEVSI